MRLVNDLIDTESQQPLNDQSQTLQDALAAVGLTLEAMGTETDAAAFSDDVICEMMERLKAEIEVLAESFPRVGECTVLEDLLVPDNAELVRYIGCLAQGGPSHIAGWRDVLSGNSIKSSRNAIVYGIIGRALKEHVFGELYFGASGVLAKKLNQMESDQINNDGRRSV